MAVALLGLRGLGGQEIAKAESSQSTGFHYVTSQTDPLTRSGFEHYYELDYPAAIRDFEKAAAAYPEDPFAVNHLLAGVFFQELYHAGALESSLYANNGFLDNKTPIHIEPATDARIQQLISKAEELANKRIRENPNDSGGYYARGVAKGMRSTYTGLVKKSWFGALGDAKAARHDHEKVLELDPKFSDARLVVGIHLYIVGSLAWPIRMMAHVVGESGNRSEGLKDIRAAAEGGGDAAVDASVVEALFLRREERYTEALQIQRRLTAEHPNNFLFAMEEANIQKDAGMGQQSIATYRRVLAETATGKYYDPHLEFAYYGLGEALRGQKDFAGAAEAYDAAAARPNSNPAIRLRSELGAGEMYDLLKQRERAVQKYQNVIATNSESPQADIARKNMKEPYRN